MASKRHGPFMLILALAASSCATAPDTRTVDIAARKELGRIAVTASGSPPDIEIAGIPKDKGEGATRGATTAGGSCLQAMASAGCSGVFCGAVLLVGGMICAGATVVGGLAGAASTDSADAVAASRGQMEAAGNTAIVQSALRDEVARLIRAEMPGRYVEVPDNWRQPSGPAGRDYRALAALGVDSVLEVNIVSIKIVARGTFDPPLELRTVASAQMLSTRDNTVFYAGGTGFAGTRLKLSEWSADGAAALRNDLIRAYTDLSRHIVDHSLKLYPFPYRGMRARGFMGTNFGLAPEYPPNRGVNNPNDALGGWQWASVDSLRPELRWENFPRKEDAEAAPDVMARVRNVRYDLLIASEKNGVPAGLVYTRDGIESASHRLESVLEPGRRFFWTVRARFELDGETYVTEWGRSAFFGHGLTSPNMWSYRFSTP